jgi:hypothetical protein
MVDGVSQSEMHIGLRTQAFGSVEVHTVVRDSQLGLAVGSEKGDLKTFLAAETPALQTAFRQHDLRFDDIHFLGSGGNAGSGSAGADSQSRRFQQGQTSPAGFADFDGSPEEFNELDLGHDAPARLNVHA